MNALTPIYTHLRSAAHYLDQPQVINKVHRFVKGYGLYGAVALLAAYDIYKAPADKRGKVILEDGLVLGSTTAATAWGLKKLSEEAPAMAPVPKALQQRYRSLGNLLSRGTVNARGHFSLGDIRRIVGTVLKEGGKVAKKEGHLDKIFPLVDGEDSAVARILKRLFTLKLPFKKDLRELPADKMAKFFGVGGVIVLAGLAGGLFYDWVTGNKEKKAAVNKIKEGTCQFIANIALCAVGASLGMTTVSILKDKFPKNAILQSRGTRFGIILAGLSLGIVWGGVIANWIGRRLVNPFFEWLEKKDQGYTFKQALKNARKENDRKVELLDAILHLDDMPTALALAGVQIFVPFIPLFFAMSGYRTGKGYRNKPDIVEKPAASQLDLAPLRRLRLQPRTPKPQVTSRPMATAVTNPFLGNYNRWAGYYTPYTVYAPPPMM